MNNNNQKFKVGDFVYMGGSSSIFGIALYGIVIRTEDVTFHDSVVAVAYIQWAGKDHASLIYSDKQPWHDIIIKAAA